MNNSKKRVVIKSDSLFDVVVVGSGPAGVAAAYPLVRAGLKVAIIDGGLDSNKQDKYVESFKDINFSPTSNAYNLIKKSSFVFNKTYQLLKLKSNIEIIQSLAKGGLSQQWHGICDFFSDSELEMIGLPVGEIKKEYKEIIKLIKVKLPEADPKAILYQAPVAFNYRSSASIDELKKYKNFTYIPNQLVTLVKDKKDHVEIKGFSIDKSLKSEFKAEFLILAAGSINTTRILLRSLKLFNYKTTFLTKAHCLFACLSLRIFSSQQVMSSKTLDKGLGAFFIQFYKFNPQAIDKVLQYVPLPKFVTRTLLSFFAPLMSVADIRFPSFSSERKFCRLIKNNLEDFLEISFEESMDELKSHQNQLAKIKRQLFSFGLFPIKTTSDYATSHYGGGVPYQEIPGKLSVDSSSKLHQANRIYLADASTWRVLPAKAPTLTIMANAARIGKNVLRDFKSIYQTKG